MFRGHLAFFLLFPIAAAPGCTQYHWVKEGGTQAQFNRDSYECQMEAVRAYPAAIVTQQLTAGYSTPGRTNCYSTGSAYGSGNTAYGSSSTNCTTTPSQSNAPVTYTVDANQNNRVQAGKACLFARGYKLIRKE